MSRSTFIDISIVSETKTSIDFIKALIKAGWTFNDYGSVMYLPINDNDDFDWQREKMPDFDLIKILIKKEKLNETIGVVLTWKNTNIGGEVLFKKDKTILFNLSMNRKVVSHDFNVIDATWYFKKIIPGLTNHDTIIKSIKLDEHF